MPVQELPDYFDGIIEILTTYIEQKTDHFTLQTYGGDYINGPYVQALQENDNVLLIEAISNEFLVPELSEHGQQAMVFMGWRFFPSAISQTTPSSLINLIFLPVRSRSKWHKLFTLPTVSMTPLALKLHHS